MKTPRHLAPGLAVIALVMAVASPLRAADPALEQFRNEIDAVVSGLAPGSSGILEWVGAEPFEIRRDGDTLIAVITGVRLTLHTDDILHVALDHLDVRQTSAQNGRDTRDLTVLLPEHVIIADENGTETQTHDQRWARRRGDRPQVRAHPSHGSCGRRDAHRPSRDRRLDQRWAAGHNVEARRRARRAVACTDRVRAHKGGILPCARTKPRSYRSDCF